MTYGFAAKMGGVSWIRVAVVQDAVNASSVADIGQATLMAFLLYEEFGFVTRFVSLLQP